MNRGNRKSLRARRCLAALFTAGLGLFGALPAIAAVSAERVEQALQELDQLAPQLLARSGVPGMAVTVVSADAVLYQRGFGVRERGFTDAVDDDTVFQLASLSKPLASTVIAGLVTDTVVDWDKPVASLLSEFALADPWVSRHVTLADLLSHRSGLPGHAGDLLEDIGYSQDDILRRLRCLPLAPFRAHYDYTNFGFTAAALAAAAAAGTDWDSLAEQRLFTPLGMHQSSYRHADYLTAPNRATAHAYVEGDYLPLYQRDADAQTPAGGASSSIGDMALWLRLLLADGKLNDTPFIAASALLPTQQPQAISQPAPSADKRASFYGLGWGVGYDAAGRVRLSHSGAFLLGAATHVSLYPGEDIGIVVLTNGAPYGLAEATAQSFFDLLFQGQLSADWLTNYHQAFTATWTEERAFMSDYSQAPTAPTPPLANTAYYGAYYHPYYGMLWVSRQAGGLMMWLGPRFMAFPLRHWDGNLFVFETTGENAVGLSGAEFRIGADGQAADVLLERYQRRLGGVFTRVPNEAIWQPRPSCADSVASE
jgi:CubicO group peptidase (beta-lactamase class C family)